MKKILLIAPLPPPMHGSNYMAKLFLELNFPKGITVKSYNCSYISEIKNIGKFSLKKIILLLKHLLNLIKITVSYRPKYVIFIPAFNYYNLLRDFIFVFISFLLGNKNILWIHSGTTFDLKLSNKPFYNLISKNIFSISTCIVPCSSFLPKKNYMYFSEENKIYPINNGIEDLQNNKDIDFKKSGFLKIVFISNMELTKGWKVLFDAALLITSYSSKISFEFYGNPTSNSTKNEIEKLFDEVRDENIFYNGPVYGDEKIIALKSADLFCFPTYYPTEAFPLVILEAMACGLPVVTTDQGGITEAIIDGKGGFIVKKNDPKDLAEKLEILINDKELRLKMGQFNRQRYLENFTLEKFEENWIKFFNTLGTDKNESK